MTENLANELILQKNKVIQSIREIEETCAGIENKNNAKKVSELNIKQAKLFVEKSILRDKLEYLEQDLNEISEEIKNLSETAINKILKAIKNQRWYFFKNKPKILMDKYTGILWANLECFKYKKTKNDKFSYNEAKQIIDKLNLDGYKNWSIPTNYELWNMISDKTFPYCDINGNNFKILGESCWYIKYTNDTCNSKNLNYSGDYKGLGNWKSGLLPCNYTITSEDYINNINEHNNIYSERERLQFVLNVFISNGLEPIFNDDEITQLYRKIYIEKPKLIQKLTEIQDKINKSQQEVKLSSTFDYNLLLTKYNIEAIECSVIKYYEAVQCWINELMYKLDSFEEFKQYIIRDFNIISLKLSRKYENNPNLTEEENILLKNRQQFFKRYF